MVAASPVTSWSSWSSRLPARSASAPGPVRRIACQETAASGLPCPWNQQPQVRLRQPPGHRLVGRLPLRLRLPGLMRVEVELLLLVEDRHPGQVPAQGLVEVLVARLVRRQEDQAVAEQPRRTAARLQDFPRRGLGRIVRVPRTGVLRGEHHQPRVEVVRHVRSRAGQDVDAVEAPAVAQVLLQPLLQLPGGPVRVGGQLLGPVLGQLGDRRLRGVPLPRAVLVEVGRLRRQSAQGVAEHRGGFPRHDAAELDPGVVDAAVRRRGGWRRSEVDGARHPAAWPRACRGWAPSRRGRPAASRARRRPCR